MSDRTLAAAQLNLAALSTAPMDELLGLLTAAVRDPGTSGPPAEQLAEYVLAETVRLIRLGGRIELADASAALSRLLTKRVARTLAESHAGAHTSLRGASEVLGVAASPASSGGELAVLRSYGGKALAVVWHLCRAERGALPRARLLELLGVEESYLSHLLADLETAALIERIRDGRRVTVHLGARAYMRHVRDVLSSTNAEDVVGAAPPPADAEIVRAAFARIDREAAPGVPVPADLRALTELWRQLAQRRRPPDRCQLIVDQTLLESFRADVSLRLQGTPRGLPGALSAERHWAAPRPTEKWECSLRLAKGAISSARVWPSPTGAPGFGKASEAGPIAHEQYAALLDSLSSQQAAPGGHPPVSLVDHNDPHNSLPAPVLKLEAPQTSLAGAETLG